MTAGLLVDGTLAAAVIGLAVWTIAARSAFASVTAFAGYGIALVVVWFRLGAPNVALTEGAVGAGLSALLLFFAATKLDPSEDTGRAGGPGLHVVAGLVSMAVAGALGWLVWHLPTPAPSLAGMAREALPALGVGNPVAATLMGFRALDTLIEVGVVFLALAAVWSLARTGDHGAPPLLPADASMEALSFMARLVVPAGVLTASFLLWNGSDAHGGEFPAAAVLAAMWLLALCAGLARIPAASSWRLRLLLIAGPSTFLAIGAAGVVFTGNFLGYPAGFAKAMILCIEIPLTASLAAVLALLIAGPPERES